MLVQDSLLGSMELIPSSLLALIKKTMRKIIRIGFIALVITLVSCVENKNSENNELKRKELELKEKELELREKELNFNNQKKTEEKESLSSIYGTVKRGVYLIYTENEEGVSQGSAFVVDRSGLAISNYHVFKDASSAIAMNEFGDKFMISEIIEFDKEKDFIIFRLGNQNNIPFLNIAEQTPKIGESVFAVGNPKGLSQTLSTGIISGFRSGNNLLQTTTAITHGSSGGPLFNEKGQVIGVTTSGLGEANLNFALNIKSIPVLKYVNQIRSSNLSSNLSENEIKDFISKYYKTLIAEDWNSLLSIYSNKLNRFYDKFNVDNFEAVTSAKNYKSQFGITRANYDIRWNTLSSVSSNFGTEIRFTMDYKIERKDKNKASTFVLDIIMVV
jgi:serine protease Do